jgi:non-lysosomal glucosylceramidase
MPERPGSQASWQLRTLVGLLPGWLRLRRELARERSLGRALPIVAFDSRDTGPVQGVPLGGIGCGSMTRGWRGDFTRFALRPGLYRYGVVPADQFSLWTRRGSEPARALVLNPRYPPRDCLAAWQWGMDGSTATYHALFPRAWTVYEEPLPGLRLTCRQISPVIPHEYLETSMPAAVFVWELENAGKSAVDASLMFTFENGDGSEPCLAGSREHHDFRLPGVTGDVHGVNMQSTLCADPLSFSIAARAGPGVEITCCPRFSTRGDGGELWAAWCRDGRLAGCDPARASGAVDSASGAVGAAVAARLSLLPGETRELAFSLAWDMPLARFGGGTGYYRRYTRMYGREGTAAPVMAADALDRFPAWESSIEEWQRPVLQDPELPGWYKSALFNELYYLVDGGTLWTDGGAEAEGEPPLSAAASAGEFGRFAYLEGHEYRYYNTCDVHFYASFALAMLWPELEKSVQLDFLRAIEAELPQIRRHAFSGRTAPRKTRGAVPHDLGSPGEDPWRLVNAYTMHDTSRWKDLAPKLVLMVLRDVLATADERFLREAAPRAIEAMLALERFDLDGDGLIECEGIGDQTYDAWPALGPSAYCGSLWLAGLSASAALADKLGNAGTAAACRSKLARASRAYEAQLWNGSCYRFDASRRRSATIMADQLVGQWYARACGLPPIVPPDHAKRALATVFACNVMGYRGGTMGAVNGMRPTGEVDDRDQHAREVWPGVTYAVAAAMLQEGLRDEAMRTAHGAYAAAWEQLGYWFQTPEAWTGDGAYRSLASMRPLAIWAMQWAHERVERRTEQSSSFPRSPA